MFENAKRKKDMTAEKKNYRCINVCVICNSITLVRLKRRHFFSSITIASFDRISTRNETYVFIFVARSFYVRMFLVMKLLVIFGSARIRNIPERLVGTGRTVLRNVELTFCQISNRI